MKVAVLFGGKSAEREVSLASGEQIAQALSGMGYDVATFDMIHDVFPELRNFSPDVVFIGLHGRLGEDGTVQGALEVMGYPYVGSGVLASALAMDKYMTKVLLRGFSLPFARDVLCTRSERPSEQEINRIGEQFGWPLIIKPNQEGSTIGLTLAHSTSEAMVGLENAFMFDRQVLVEEYIAGTEVTAVVVGETSSPKVLEVIEIIPRAELYDYDSKYAEGGSQHIMPARLDAAMMQSVKDIACTAYQSLLCRDYARVDFIIGATGPVLLEVNTLPGMTKTSLVPDAARANGIPFGQFLDSLVQTAYQRKHKTD